MAFVWMQGNSFTKIATLYDGNITLNTPCIKFFEKIRWCLIGINRTEKSVAIKLVTNEELNANKYIPEVLNRVSVGKSYVRISNKNIIQEISKILNKKCEGEKYIIEYEDKDKQIIIDLKKKV